MHYSPLLPGAGLLALGLMLSGSSGPGSILHIVTSIAGIVFLLLASVFLMANVIGFLARRVLGTGPAPRPLVAKQPQ